MAGIESLKERARAIRARIVRMAHPGRTPHVASALSCADVVAALYFLALRIDPAAPADEGSDRFVLRKGHGCMVLCAALAEHPAPHCVPGIEVATGSLGHGLSLGAGLALAAKIRGQRHRVFVLLSDGECAEGSVWEAALFASAHGLDNLVTIVDYNNWSAMDRTSPYLEPLGEKWKAFGWSSVEIDGHDAGVIVGALSRAPFEPLRPSAMVAHTVKGKGVSFMEDDLEWHYRPPNDNDLWRARDPVVHGSAPPFSIGRAIVVREGGDCALIATGGMLPVAVAAAAQLAGEGIGCRVVSMHTVKPLDEALLHRCAVECGAVFTLEEHGLTGGLGSAVGEWLAASGVRCRLRCYGAGDEFAHLCGGQEYFRRMQGITAEQIAGRVREALKERVQC